MKQALRTILLASLAGVAMTASMSAQSAGRKALLDKAHSLETSGHIDLAAQSWQQVLLSDPNNAQAIAGLARWAKMSGNNTEAAKYLDRLRQINPANPAIASVQSMSSTKTQDAKLAQAARLGKSGQPDQALKLYREIWGNQPPDGDWALAYYDTEAATNSGREDAIRGLRTLTKKYPSDSRYAITLGRILTYQARTRAEGERMLRRYSQDGTAQTALRQALGWDVQNPNSAGIIRDYLKQHRDEQLQQQLADTEARQAKSQSGLANTAAERTAYADLNANRLDEAQSRFMALSTEQPNNPRALAGMGFLRMKQSNFSGAIEYFEQAEQHGLRLITIHQALTTSRFWDAMQQATTALNANLLEQASAKYRAALAIRPDSPEAIEGLAGVSMKAQHPAEAVVDYQKLVRLHPGSASAWRGLFLAETQSADPNAALATSQRFPPDVRGELAKDPDFLRSLAAAYTAAGQDAQAQQVLAQALNLPFPDNGRNMKASTRMQYAALLEAAKHYQQAAGLYRGIVENDPTDVSAWKGLVGLEHQMGQDPDAVSVVEQMPPDTYDAALSDLGFLQQVSSIYQQQNHLDIAQNFLERALKMETGQGQQPSQAIELQLASIYLQRNNPQQAYAIYRRVLIDHPDHVDGWKGLMSALHQTGHDREALAQIAQIPPVVMRSLDRDVNYQQTLAAIYASTGHSQAAMQELNVIQAHYRSQHVAPPADVEIQDAWLLFNAGDDRDLYPALMRLGGRSDMTDDQRRQIQAIWANWSVRRAEQSADAGNTRRSLQILNAAAQAFPGNPDVSKALASGYLAAGDPRQAMAIYASLDLTSATSGDYQGMVGAALAAKDMKRAEDWLREALEKYPHDPQVLSAAARFEQARGDNARAAAYWKASLNAMPQVSPQNELAHSLSRPDAIRQKQAGQSADLASLLNPNADARYAARSTTPPLPGYGQSIYTSAPATTEQETPYGPDPVDSPGTPIELNGSQSPVPVVEYRTPAAQTYRRQDNGERLGDYTPQVSLNIPVVDPAPAPVRIQDDARLGSPAAIEPTPRLTAAPVQLQRPNTEIAAVPAPWTTEQTSVIHEVPNIAIDAPRLNIDEQQARENQASAAQAALAAASQPIGEPVYIPAQYTIQPAATSLQAYYAQPGSQPPPVYQQQQAAAEPQSKQQQGVSDRQLMQQSLPPLRGPYSRAAAVPTRSPRDEAELQLERIEGGYSPWFGGSGTVNHRTGAQGFDNLTTLEAPFEVSTSLGSAVRLTLITKASFLDAGVADGASTDRLGTLPATATPAQQNAAGVGGELQLATSNFGIGVGYTPYGFLVTNIIGRMNWRPAAGPVTLSFSRDPVKDTQLSYSGLRDPGSATPTYSGNIWGGVIANSGEVQLARGDEKSGMYISAGGQYLTGRHVQTNNRFDGDAGAYWQVLNVPDTGTLSVGANFFGMHYSHNLRYFTYGQGGYFSPEAYFLANVPVSWAGRYGQNFHYTVNGSLGTQAFQEGSAPYYPLDPALEANSKSPYYPTTSNIGSNYDFHAQGGYLVNEHWYIGGSLGLNNTRDYDNQSVGFFIRFLFRPQAPTDLGPTGLFPSAGLRPFMVP